MTLDDWEKEIELTKEILDSHPLPRPERWMDLNDYCDWVEEQFKNVELPEEFNGDIFNFIDHAEFGEYLEKRLGVKIEEVIKYYILY